MANGRRVAEHETLEAISDAETPPPGGEGGRLLAAALTAALLEYRRQLQAPDGDADGPQPAVEWRLLTRWEQMAFAARSGGRGRA